VSAHWLLPTRLAATTLAAVVMCACTSDPERQHPTSTSTAPAAPAKGDRPECADIVGRFSRALSKVRSEPPVERLAEIRAAAVEAGEDPAGCIAERLDTMVIEQRRRLVRLSLDGQEAAPAAIYECPELGPNFRCAGARADDTAHLGELTSGSAVSDSGTVRMEIAADYKPTATTFYLLKTPGGSLEVAELPLKLTPPLYAVVVIVKEDDGGHVKYVWLLRAR